MALSTIDEVLEHHGIKGMKWGVRRDRTGRSSAPTDVLFRARPGKSIETKGGRNQPAVPDAINAAVLRQRAKQSGPQSLSNQELRVLIDRMNLEQQYSRLNPRRKSRGQQFIEGPGPGIALNVSKDIFKDSKDPRVQQGLQIAEVIVKSTRQKKK